MRVAFDTNILAYAEGVNGSEMKRQALAFVETLPDNVAIIPVQALGELFHLLGAQGAAYTGASTQGHPGLAGRLSLSRDFRGSNAGSSRSGNQSSPGNLGRCRPLCGRRSRMPPPAVGRYAGWFHVEGNYRHQSILDS